MSQQLPAASSAEREPRHVPVGQDAQSSPSGLFSLTYEPYYGLSEKPFSLSANPKFLYRGSGHTPAFDALVNGIRRREGLLTLTGDAGTGKTTVIRSVLQHLDRRTFSAFLADPLGSREDLLKVLLVDFGVVSMDEVKRGSLNGASRPELSYRLYDFFDSLVPLQTLAVLIIDEAQNLPLPLFEEIKILSDLEGREKLLQVVLVGQPELRQHLTMPEMRPVNQRVAVRCELSPLERDDVAGYIEHRLQVAGGDGRTIFGSAAIDAIFDATKGTPRLINLICDRALHRGSDQRLEQIEPHVIRDAVADLRLDANSEPEWSQTQGEYSGANAISAFASEAASTTPTAPARVPSPVSRPKPASRQPVSAPPPRSVSSRRERVFLSDFAAETEPVVVPAPPEKRPRWVLMRAALFAAAFAASVVLTYLRVRTITDTSIAVPPSPQRIVPQLPVVAPPGREPLTIQVASIAQIDDRETVSPTRISRR